MQYFEVVHDESGEGNWQIHPVQCEGNIELDGAIFFGPQGKQRAEEYAEWMAAHCGHGAVGSGAGG